MLLNNMSAAISAEVQASTITSHPLWEEQVELEYGMMRAGADKVRDRVIEAERKGQMTRVSPVKGLLKDWLPGVADTIKDWCATMRRSRGVKPAVLPLVESLDPYVAGAIALRTMLDQMAKGYISVQATAATIGQTVEYEQRVRLWEKTNKKMFRAIQKEQEDMGSTAEHKRRVNINRFNNFIETGELGDKLTWTPWTNDQKFRVGWCLMDCIVRKTQWFEVISDPHHVFKAGKPKSPMLVIAPKPGLMEWLAKALDVAEANQPEFKPTVVPPKRWNGTRDGGYWTPYVRAPRLIRFKAHQEHQKERAADEYEALDFPKVYAALNTLQETAWRINQRVLDVVNEVWTVRRWAIGKPGSQTLPEMDEREFPPRTPRMEEDKERQRQWKRDNPKTPPPPADEQTQKEIDEWKAKAAPIWRFNVTQVGRCRAASATVNIANQFSKYDAFYFPHMLDFRGRMYPIPNYLQPQGNDLSRGLLEFATSAPITHDNGGIRWLAIHLASVWGNDKVSYEARIKWVEDNEEMLRNIAMDPYANNEWVNADKPLQALAATFEWVDYLHFGEGFMSSLPVMVDGTCNGIQHLSAITRDEVAGAYVNLVPSDEPQDIYKFVARRLQAILEDLPHDEDARWWLELCNHDLPRSLTKRQVMVLPYGGTKDSFFGYTRAWLDENTQSDRGLTPEQKEVRNRRVTFLALKMWQVVNDVVSGGMKVMKWLQDVARVAALNDQPIYWTVPSGFVVRHFYGLERDYRVDCLLDGTRTTIQLKERTAELSIREQLQGISPNFIHSLDASCLVDCLNMCTEVGIVAFASVHDAYGTHAANMDLLANLLRRAFVETHETDVLGMFKAAAVGVIVPVLLDQNPELDVLDASVKAEEMIAEKAKPLEMGTLDLQDVMHSEYFFA
jgi:DNA-directed RNA polymerase